MLRRLCLLLCGILLLILAGGCHREEPSDILRLTGETMGTTWSVALFPAPDTVDAATLRQGLQQRLDQINSLMSTYDPASEISRFNTQTGTDWFAISDETARVIALSQDISTLTDGAFDISVGPLVELWGFGAAPRGKTIPSEDLLGQTLAQVGYGNIRLRRDPPAVSKELPELRIDLSAVAKGYAVDALAELLRQRGISNYLVEIGGELLASGQRGDGSPWRIAIEKPLEDMREVATVFQLTDTALATSGNYRNFYVENGQRFAHTLDPASGRPTRNRLASVTVLDPSCARADALATALMVMGEVKAPQFSAVHGIAAYFFIFENETLEVFASPAFEAFMEEVKQ